MNKRNERNKREKKRTRERKRSFVIGIQFSKLADSEEQKSGKVGRRGGGREKREEWKSRGKLREEPFDATIGENRLWW